MKLRPNKHYATIAIYAFAVLAAAILLHTAVDNISGIWSGVIAVTSFIRPAVYGAFLAILLSPLLRFYDIRLLPKLSRGKLSSKWRRIIAIIMTYVSLLILIVALFCLFIPQFVRSVQSLIANMPGYIESLNRFLQSATGTLEEFRLLEQDSRVNQFLDNLSKQFTTALSSISDNFEVILSTAFSGLFFAGARVAAGTVNWLLGLVISVYLLYDKEKLFAQIRKISTALLPKRAVNLMQEVAMEAGGIFNGFLVGKVIGSLLVGLLCSLGMAILRIPYPLPIGALIGITNIIPYFGPFIGTILGVLLILLIDPFKALLFLIFIIILQQFDNNILGPKILGGRTGLSALWVVFSVLLFGGLFGLFGTLLGVPMFAVLYTVIKRFIAYLLARKGKSTNTRDYASKDNPLIK